LESGGAEGGSRRKLAMCGFVANVNERSGQVELGGESCNTGGVLARLERLGGGVDGTGDGGGEAEALYTIR